MTSMRITALAANFGAEVTGIDLATGIDDATFDTLQSALHEHLVLVIRDQELDQENYLRFGRRFGAPIPHVLANSSVIPLQSLSRLSQSSGAPGIMVNRSVVGL